MQRMRGKKCTSFYYSLSLNPDIFERLFKLRLKNSED